MKPILITATHKLSKKEDCVKNCPILLNEDQQFTESINFHTGCKNTKCVSKLNLAMNLKTEQNYENPNQTDLIDLRKILVGFHQYALLHVKISNQGEQAYTANLNLIIKPALQIKKIESRCRINDATDSSVSKNNSMTNDYSNDNLEINCNLGNPFERGSIELRFIFDLFHTELSEQSLIINGSIQTLSQLTDDSKISKILDVPIRRQITLSLKE